MLRRMENNLVEFISEPFLARKDDGYNQLLKSEPHSVATPKNETGRIGIISL